MATEMAPTEIYTPGPPQPIDATMASKAVAVMEETTEAVSNTVMLKAILGVVLVAFVLTLLELISIVYIVFPAIKTKIKTMFQSQSESMKPLKPLKPLIQTLATRETGFTQRANSYIQLIAWMFTILLALGCWFLVHLINNEYRLRGKAGAPRGTFSNIVFWSFVTIGGIAIFQGFGCIALGVDSYFCSTNSFVVVSSEWKQNDNFSHIALSTGICDDVADTDSFTNQVQGFNRVLSHLSEQITNQQISDTANQQPVSTRFRELASDDAQNMLNQE